MGEPALENEPATTLETQPDPGPDPGLIAKLGAVAQSATQKVLSTIKPGRGRPRKDGLPKVSDTILPLDSGAQSDKTPGPVPIAAAAPAPDTILSLEIIERVCKAAIQGICKLPESLIRVIASKRKVPAVMLESHLAKCTPLEAELDALAKVLPIIAQKHGLDLANSPEGIAIAVGAIILARYGVCAVTIAKIEIPHEQTEENNSNNRS